MSGMTILELCDILQDYLQENDQVDLPVFISLRDGATVPLTDDLVAFSQEADGETFDVLLIGP